VWALGQDRVNLEGRIDTAKLAAALLTIHGADNQEEVNSTLELIETFAPNATYIDLGAFVTASCGADVSVGVARAMHAVLEPMEGSIGEANAI
jgi:hypothetical protein